MDLFETALSRATATNPLTPDQAGKMVYMELIEHATATLQGGARKKMNQGRRNRIWAFANDEEVAAESSCPVRLYGLWAEWHR